jgi:putative oxidoreductase
MNDATRAHLHDAGLLALRLAFGGTLLVAHGLPKLLGFAEKSATFSDPLGVGSTASLVLTIFGEVVCAGAVVLGAGTRLAALPATITMLVAAFVVHAADPFGKRELALAYAAAFIVIGLAGPGRLSIDHALARRRSARSGVERERDGDAAGR